MQEFHRHVDAAQFAAFNWQIARFSGTSAEGDGVKVGAQFRAGDILADMAASDKFNPFGGQQVNATLHNLLVKFHVGDAIHEQPTNSVRSLVDGDAMSGLVELRRAGQPRGTGADHRDLFARAHLRRLRDHPTLVKALVDDRALNALDCHRRIDDPQGARTFAGGRADPTSKFGKIVGLVQTVERLLPVAFVDQIIPFGNQVVDWATRRQPINQGAGVTERDAAIHTAGTLLLQGFIADVQVKFIVIQHPLQWGAFRR